MENSIFMEPKILAKFQHKQSTRSVITIIIQGQSAVAYYVLAQEQVKY